MVREFSIVQSSWKHSCRSLGALPKTCKKFGVVAEIFLLKALGDVLHSVMEIKPGSPIILVFSDPCADTQFQG